MLSCLQDFKQRLGHINTDYSLIKAPVGHGEDEGKILLVGLEACPSGLWCNIGNVVYFKRVPGVRISPLP